MSAVAASTDMIFIIRHGEKPDTPPPFGVDIDGNQDVHSLLPLGWQRAGALATLFAPFDDDLRPGLATPTQLYAPDYGSPTATAEHRTYETILPLSQLTTLSIDTPYPEGQEAQLAASAMAAGTTAALICWEHTAIPTIAAAIMPGTKFPQWPGDRFDVVWTFVLDPAAGTYAFGQIPEMLLAGDSNTVIGQEAAP
jgi:hypothetical protein